MQLFRRQSGRKKKDDFQYVLQTRAMILHSLYSLQKLGAMMFKNSLWITAKCPTVEELQADLETTEE